MSLIVCVHCGVHCFSTDSHCPNCNRVMLRQKGNQTRSRAIALLMGTVALGGSCVEKSSTDSSGTEHQQTDSALDQDSPESEADTSVDEPSSEPSSEPAMEPSVEPSQPANEPTEPANEPTSEPAQEVSQPAQEPSEPASEPSPEPAIETLYGVVTTDEDGDGWSPDMGDCDDNNPNIHPDAPETPNDGIDSNCNGDDNS